MNNSLREMLLIYKDICNEIEYYEILLGDMDREFKINKSLMFTNPRNLSGEGYVPIPLDRAALNVDKLFDRYERIEKLLEFNKRMKKTAEDTLNKFEGLEYKVAYMRFVDSMRLEDIADRLGYSEAHIKRISAKITCYLQDTDLLGIE